MKTRYGSVAVLLCLILVVSMGLTAVLGVNAPKTTNDLSVVASFYPLYTAALNVVGSCDGVTVSCLTQPTTGCLHDYQLSPSERAVLGEADVLIQNGAGMEPFLEPILHSLPTLTVIDTSAHMELLSGDEHDHAHEHDHSENAHVWVDPEFYTEQVRRLRDGLCAADPAHAEEYTVNAAVYLTKIEQLGQALKSVELPFTHALLFHDSMVYAARALGLEVVGNIPLGEDRFASANDLMNIAEALKGKAVLLLYDEQYPAMHESLGGYADKAGIVRWNTAVHPTHGVAAKDAWLYAMGQNIKMLKEAVS